MPQYGIRCMISRRSGGMKSSIIEHATSVKNHKLRQKWKIRPSMVSGVRQVRKINDVKSPIVAHVTSVKIRKSHPKQKYALVWVSDAQQVRN